MSDNRKYFNLNFKPLIRTEYCTIFIYIYNNIINKKLLINDQYYYYIALY